MIQVASAARHRRENVQIRVKNPYPTVDVHCHTEPIPKDGILLRTLFSLTGTLREETVLRRLPDFLGLSLHPGYASVGMVEEVGSAYGRFEPGDVVVMPVSHSTYVTLTGAHPSGLSRLLLQRIPSNMDMVSATFMPLVSLSLYLVRQVAGREPVALVGCGLVGAILLKLLQLDNVRVTVCTNDECDLRHDLMLGNGAEVVLNCMQRFPERILGKARIAFVLSSSKWCSWAASRLVSRQGKCISATASADSARGDGRCPPWLAYDNVQDALSLLCDGDFAVKDLIAQHVHAEVVTQIYRAIQQNHYHGQAIVYDW